jgi:hypothetical protein
VNRALVPLSMSSVSDLPEPCRSCVNWELPIEAGAPLDAGSRAFEKEVWLSGVMLTWGSAGLIVTVDDVPAGYALFAPPTAVPGATAFPTSPVSADAVLLTAARINAEHSRLGLGRYLLTGVVAALTRRGVRAIEAFGVEPGVRAPRRPQHPTCLLPADFLRAVGFVDVRPHHRYPRLRLELASGLGWKAEVEAALEKLMADSYVGAGAAAPVGEPVPLGV